MGSNDSIITEQVDSRLDDLFGKDDEQSPEDENDETGSRLDDHEANTELDNRLDNFFEKEDMTDNESEDKNTIDPHEVENSSIKDLKSVILSLEWEITDQVMQKLGEEIQKLEGICKDDKIVVAFLQLLGSLGKYIRNKRSEAHPDSIRLLHSVYDNLERVMLSDDLSDAAKKKMLVAQVSRYKKLKEEIVVAKKSAPKKEAAEKKAHTPSEDEAVSASEEDKRIDESKSSEKETDSKDMAGMGNAQDILAALEEIRKTIQHEFSLLRAELKAWREEQK